MIPPAVQRHGPRSFISILLLEDSDLDAELISEFVKRTGLPHEIERVVTREAFIEATTRNCHDLILADYVLPSFDGLSALMIAREHCPRIPFVFVSGTLGEEVAVEALKGGATDYVTKQKLDRLPRTILRALSEARLRAEREAAEKALRELNETLEARIEERTRELAEANAELRRQIAERERAEGALRQSQRMEAVGQLTSGIAHDFNNLLTVIYGSISFLERMVTDPRAQRRLSIMRTAAERGAKLTSQLLAFSRRQRLEPKPIDLNATVASMRDLLQGTMGGSVLLETQCQPDLWHALADPTQIELAILNLAINARDAMEVGGRLTVSTSNVRTGAPLRPEEPPAGEYVMVAVADNGTGIPPAVLDRVFEPFFTTKEVGKGSGLGLAQVYGFAKQSGGGVRIRTELGVGTTVEVYLPRAERAADMPPEPRLSTPEREGRPAEDAPIILVVDDDSAVREITATSLAELGCRVHEAASGGAALAFLEEHPAVDLIVLDFAMPGMNGAEVAREIRRMRQDLPVLFVTGYADTAALIQAGETGDEFIVQKPYRDGELMRKVRAILGRRHVVPA
jgi:signal transduction histidine kinase